MAGAEAAAAPGVAVALTAPGALTDRVHALFSYATTTNLSYVLAAAMFVVLFQGDVSTWVLGGWAGAFGLVIAGRAWTTWSYHRVGPSDDAASVGWLRAWNVGTLASGALWGASGWFGGLEGSTGVKVIFGLPGMVLATLFVTLPFVVREVEPVLHEIGTEQEQAASTLGASGWQTFWRITLPAIRWGLTYGVVLTVARALGEFGAVIMVSSGFPGVSQTLTLLVHSRYIDDHNTYGAYAAATVLMGLAVATLLLMTLLDRKRSTR